MSFGRRDFLKMIGVAPLVAALPPAALTVPPPPVVTRAPPLPHKPFYLRGWMNFELNFTMELLEDKIKDELTRSIWDRLHCGEEHDVALESRHGVTYLLKGARLAQVRESHRAFQLSTLEMSLWSNQAKIIETSDMIEGGTDVLYLPTSAMAHHEFKAERILDNDPRY